MPVPTDANQAGERFGESYARVLATARNGRGFFDAFYARFMETSPEVPRKFARTDMAEQKQILKRSFYHMLNYHVTRSPSEYMRHLARLHNQAHHDIGPELYALWLDALLATVAEFDREYSEPVAAAWRRVMSDGIGFMLAHYET